MAVSECKQAFVVILETGKVFLAVVEGEDRGHGEGLATSAVQEAHDGQVWDIAAYPVTDDLECGVSEMTLPVKLYWNL